MKFNAGDKYKLIKNCLGEHLNTEITILENPYKDNKSQKEIDEDNRVFVRLEWYAIKIDGKVKKTEECFLGADYLEKKINKGKIVKIKGDKNG